MREVEHRRVDFKEEWIKRMGKRREKK